jgi:hypothetical protein
MLLAISEAFLRLSEDFSGVDFGNELYLKLELRLEKNSFHVRTESNHVEQNNCIIL